MEPSKESPWTKEGGVSCIVGIEHPVLNKLGLHKHGGSPWVLKKNVELEIVYQKIPVESIAMVRSILRGADDNKIQFLSVF
jgi:hypothetical protein